MSVTSAIAAGETIAAPRPCAARAATSCHESAAMPQASDAAANTTSPMTSTRRRPSRSAARPPISMKPPNVSMYASMTQARPYCENPSSVWIDGSAI